MKKHLIVLIFSLFCSALVSADSWLLYSAGDSATFGTSSVYIMKIDSLGSVKMSPLKILDQSDCPLCVGVMTDGNPGKINIILTGVHIPNPQYGAIRRAIFDTSTLSITGAKPLGIYQSNESWPISIQTTQHANRRFMVTEVSDQSARAFGLNSDGFWDGAKWRANPSVSKGQILQVGVSPDGGMSWVANGSENTNFKIYLQPLNNNGLPTGSPNVGGSAPIVLGADITNLLPGNVRFLAYSDFENGRLFVNVVNGLTGKKLVSRKLAPQFSEFVQSIALDAQGRFLVYSTPGSCGHYELRYQALDGSGQASGAPRVLVPCKTKFEFVLPDLYEE